MKKIIESFLVLLLGLFVVTGSARAESVLELLKDIEVHGFASSSYSYNFNDPASTINTNRIFDFDKNSFKFDVGELVLLKETPNPGDIGFRTDLAFGYSVPAVTRGAGTIFDVQQGYVSYNAPVGTGLQIDLGKFITHIGAEVIEGYDGWNSNFSRSFMFGLAIPFTHNGVRVGYTINDQISVLGMIANGWDSPTDANDDKTLGAQIAYAPMDSVSLLLNWAGGVETTGGNNWRHIFDVVLDIALSDKASLQLNFDYGTEEGVSAARAGTNAEWMGIAAILRHDCNKWFSMNVRGEVFNDEDGTRALVSAANGHGQELWEVTITPEVRINQNMVVRFEYRHDGSSEKSFSDNDGTPTDSQDTVAVNALFYF